MLQFNIDEIEKRTLSGLKDFQRATVERVDYLFRHNQNRVLVADEVGMGKTLIARGAIVKTARLRIEEKDDLFKVIYICSNQNIANQNIRKLDVTGKNAIGSVSDTRLSMQHLKITEQENDPQIKEGFIQLIPLTPETSFRMTTGGGSVQERALMYAILRRMPDFKGHVTSLEKFMIMDAVKAWDGWAKWNFENRVAECEKMTKGVYPQNVIEKILNYQEYESIRDMLLNHLHERRYNKQLTYSNYYVMNKLRVMFARISVSMLEPDLVIMDEFQRFKFLLSSDDSELGILATSLAKVFVNNFNLPESTAIIDLAYGRCRDDNSHWQNVLKYCKDGCFQAMIDEYIHMLKETAGFQSDGNQYQIVHDMMMDSLKIHTATYIADTYPDFKKRINGADRKSDGCRIRSSYAVGFTKDAGDNSKVVMRKENIRNAFNSPMRPFVLATTSIGQEGLDFHNYCRVIMHWNLPSNPIDVGRILRTFKIKKNVEVTDNGKIII